MTSAHAGKLACAVFLHCLQTSLPHKDPRHTQELVALTEVCRAARASNSHTSSRPKHVRGQVHVRTRKAVGGLPGKGALTTMGGLTHCT
jgi:hypothetical protein